jgi:hypothetical protein
MLSHRFETCRDKKSSHVKGWCGSGRVRSPGDFDGLDALESRFLKPQASPAGHRQTSKQKKHAQDMCPPIHMHVMPALLVRK